MPAGTASVAVSGLARGDDSGTHKKEVALWIDSGFDPTAASGEWYRETGSGMGATLNAGIGTGADVMTDRATWISFGNRQNYEIVVQGDEDMINQYGVIPVNPGKCPSVNVDAAQTFADWLILAEGQDAIAGYRIVDQKLFFPNALEN